MGVSCCVAVVDDGDGVEVGRGFFDRGKQLGVGFGGVLRPAKPAFSKAGPITLACRPVLTTLNAGAMPLQWVAGLTSMFCCARLAKMRKKRGRCVWVCVGVKVWA